MMYQNGWATRLSLGVTLGHFATLKVTGSSKRGCAVGGRIQQSVAILGATAFFPLSENLLIFIAVQRQPFIGICGPCKCYEQAVKACKTDAAGQRRIPSAAYSRDPWSAFSRIHRFRQNIQLNTNYLIHISPSIIFPALPALPSLLLGIYPPYKYYRLDF